MKMKETGLIMVGIVGLLQLLPLYSQRLVFIIIRGGACEYGVSERTLNERERERKRKDLQTIENETIYEVGRGMGALVHTQWQFIKRTCLQTIL